METGEGETHRAKTNGLNRIWHSLSVAGRGSLWHCGAYWKPLCDYGLLPVMAIALQGNIRVRVAGTSVAAAP